MSVRVAVGAIVLGLLPALAGCGEDNAYKPPPPPPVTVGRPIPLPVLEYLEATGQVAPSVSVDLMARVSGFLEKVNFQDGAQVAAGQVLFVIEPEPYQLKVAQAQASVEQYQALLKNAQAEYERQLTLVRQQVSTPANLDKALANRDSEQASVNQAIADLGTAKLNLAYTQVLAPFAGRIGRRLVDPGNVVGSGSPTKLATLQKIDPVFAYFTINERDVLRIRAAMRARGTTLASAGTVPVQAALAGDNGFPHAGRLDFVDTGLDVGTGTLQLRAVFENQESLLLPGLFVRLRIPLGQPVAGLWVPDTALGVDQTGPFVLVVDAAQTATLRRIGLGRGENGLRAVTSGLTDADQVIIDGLQNATPGRKVTPTQGKIEPTRAAAAGAPRP